MFPSRLSVHSLISHAQSARVVTWRIRRDLARGDLERPIQDLKTVLRLTRDLQPRAPAVAQLVASALDNQCCELVRTILNAPGIDAPQCDQLSALLAEHEANAIDRLQEFCRAEYIMYHQAIHDLQHRTSSFDTKRL